MQRKYDLILVDMDGTVANTDAMLIESMNQMYDLYRNGQRSPLDKMVYFSGPPIRETLTKEFPGQNIDFLLDEFHRISKGLYESLITSYPHTREVFLKLKAQGIRFGVVTNKMHDLTELALRIIRLDDIIEYIVGSTDLTKLKPDPEGMNRAIKHFEINKKRTLYIGDNVTDLETAINAGVDCCIVNWGPRTFKSDLKPTFRIKDYLELEGHCYE